MADALTDAILGRRQGAQDYAVGSLEDDPEEATRALELSRATGIDPAVIRADIPTFEANHKASLTAEILRGNPHLTSYVNSDPFAAKVSNDDWGNLDTVSQALGKIGTVGIVQEAIKGFKEKFGDPQLGAWMLQRPQDQAFVEANPIIANVLAILGAPIELPAKAIGGALGALNKGGIAALQQLGVEETIAKRAMRDITGMAEYQLQQTPGKGVGVPKIGEAFQQYVKAVETASPYIRAGKEPPVGLDPAIDKLVKEQSYRDLKNLDEALKEAQKSATRERAPELFERFIAAKNDGSIGISADAIAELYKDKRPHPEDNILGWVPDLEKQMYLALATGGDIEIPLATWLARVEPEVAKELHDFIRVRKSGITKAEGEVLSQSFMVEAYHGSPHEFDAFSLERIGTGEGAQAYGHGLYFAENRGVAETYKQPRQLGNPEYYATGRIRAAGEDVAKAIAELKQDLLDPKMSPSLKQELTKSLKLMEEGYKGEQGDSLYRVRIHADKEQFLDWDKPLLEQPQGQQLLRAIEEKHKGFRESLEEFLDERGQQPDLSEYTGNQLYQILQKWAGEDSLPGVVGDGTNLKKEASDFLRSLGIPGIKYLDQGSRPAAEKLQRLQEKAQVERNFIEAYTEMGDQAKLIEAQQALAKIEEEIKANQVSHNFVLFDDSLIEITHRNDQAVTSVRTAAKLDPLFEQPKGWTEIEGKTDRFGEGEWFPIGKDVEAFVPKEFSKYAEAITSVVEEELNRLVPKNAEFESAGALRRIKSKREVSGVYTQFKETLPVITLALEGHIDVPGIARHEAIHHLRAYGFFTNAEWATLTKAAQEEGWVAKEREGPGSSVEARYKGKVTSEKILEEAIADEFRYWNRSPNERTIAAPIFEKLRAFLEKIWEKIRELATKNPEVIEIFKKIEYGEVGKRTSTGPRMKGGYAPEQFAEGPRQGELDVTRQEDKKIFATIAGWMNKAQQLTYMELVAKRNAEDMAYQLKKAEKLERQRQSAEWKQNEGPVRAEVEADIAQRPDLGVLEFFRTGKLYGEETGTRPRVDPALLTEEQRKAFPEKYQRRDGMPPEDVANLFGYTSVDEMIAKVAQLDKEIGNKTTASFISRIVDAETERRMVQKFGDLEENILREAQEHVISDTQMDLLHEEVVALGMKVGSEMTFTKADFKQWVEAKFNDAKASEVSLEAYLRDAGKAGREVEAALLKDDPTLAFQQKQRQLLAMLLADAAKKFEKEQTQYERLAKRFSQRVVKGHDQGFVDWIQRLLLEAGEPGKRSALELEEATLRAGFTSLREFVDYYKGDGWELAVDTGLQEGRTKPVEQMTVQEFREFKESLQSLAHVGRQINKIILAGEAMDFDVFRQIVKDNIESLPPRDKNAPVRWIYKLDAELTKIEEIFKDLDLRQELGPLFNAIIRPMADAKHTEFSMLEKLTKDWKEIRGGFGKKWQRTLKDEIPQDFLIDIHDGVPYDLSREHMINIMLNFGNRSNIDKFTKGYGGKDGAQRLEGQLWRLFDQHATKEDWQYVQKVWDLWEGWRQESDRLYYDLAGVPPKWIEPLPIANQHGTFAGGYFPVIYDRFRSNLNLLEEKQPSASDKGLFKRDYFRATPGNSYTKERTGYIDRVEFLEPLDQVATRMQQTIHDISFRRAVMETGKVIYDREIRAAIRKHYGMEYEKQLTPWLEKVANQFNQDEASLQGINSWLRRSRSALIIHALGLNLKVIFSPATGNSNFGDMARFGLPFSGKNKLNTEIIMSQSKELEHTFRNIDRDFREQMDAAIHGNKWDKWQADAMKFSFYPTVLMDQYFRKVTFFNEYKKAIDAGRSEGEAAALADSHLRERHGSGAVVDLPAIMRGSEALKMATVFYGFFNTMYNWQRQIPGHLRRGEYAEAAKTGWGALVVPAIFGAVIFNQRTENESIFSTWAKALPLQLLSTIPLARDLANQFIEGHGARTPWTSFVQAGSAAYNDVRKKIAGKKVDKPIQHAANVVGLGLGLPLGQIGRTSQFFADVAQNKPNKQPRSIIEWMRGIIHGEARLKKEKK